MGQKKGRFPSALEGRTPLFFLLTGFIEQILIYLGGYESL